MNFIEYSFNRELEDFYTEIFHKDTFMNHTPENGFWKPSEPNENDEDDYEFYYSLPSDPKKMCGSMPCYRIHIYDGSISFGHQDTGIDDRWTYNKNNDNAMQIAREQINAILYAVGVYVQNVKPRKLNWTPIEKSDSTQNKNARKKVYFLWGAKNLWPDYLPVNDQWWIRKDVMLNHNNYGRFGVPDNLDQMSAKDFLKWYKDQKEQERQKEIEQENERLRIEQEQIDQALLNPQININNVKLDDIVIVHNTDDSDDPANGKLFRIKKFKKAYEEEDIIAILDPHYSESDVYPHNSNLAIDFRRMKIQFLHKATESNMSARDAKVTQSIQEKERRKQEQIQELLAKPMINPNKLALGDEVFVNSYSRRGMFGKIIDIKLQSDYETLKAIVQPLRDNDYDQLYSLNSIREFDLAELIKATPENRRIRLFNVQNINRGARIQKPDPNWQPQQPQQT